MAATDNTSPEIILGIDLGTTNSLVSVLEDAGPRVLPIDAGSPILPSVVRYSESGDAVEAVHCVADLPRFLHRRFSRAPHARRLQKKTAL
jgi:molecular chaperone DnaK (HSP70)